MIGQPDHEGELRLLEEKANATYGKYKEFMDITGDLKSKTGEMKDDIKALATQLESEQGNVSVYTDRQAKALTIKAESELELAQQIDVLKFEEDSRLKLASEVKEHGGKINVAKKNIEDIQMKVTKVEQEKGNRDHSIKALEDEIASQDEVLNKMNKEKKHLSETQAKSNEDLIGAQEKVAHLSSVKSKLESTLDEIEGATDKEKKIQS